VHAGDSALSLLPPWHIYERAVGYHLLHVGTRIVYTTIKKFRDDLTTHPPDHFVCVPLVLDSLYNKVRGGGSGGSEGAGRGVQGELGCGGGTGCG
jgi:long-chain acyl-CoA synthetase